MMGEKKKFISWEFVQAEVDKALETLPKGKKVDLVIEGSDGTTSTITSFEINIIDKDGDE